MTHPFVSPLYRLGLNGPKSTAHEYLSFPLLLCLPDEDFPEGGLGLGGLIQHPTELGPVGDSSALGLVHVLAGLSSPVVAVSFPIMRGYNSTASLQGQPKRDPEVVVRVTDTGALGLESTANACGPATAKGGINEVRNLLGR